MWAQCRAFLSQKSWYLEIIQKHLFRAASEKNRIETALFTAAIFSVIKLVFSVVLIRAESALSIELQSILRR